jgi:hypothetical protein
MKIEVLSQLIFEKTPIRILEVLRQVAKENKSRIAQF